MKLDGKCMIELIKLCKNKVQVYRFVRMLSYNLVHLHLTPIIMINDSSHYDIFLNSKYFLSFHRHKGKKHVIISTV